MVKNVNGVVQEHMLLVWAQSYVYHVSQELILILKDLLHVKNAHMEHGSSTCYENMKKEDTSSLSYYAYLLSTGFDYISDLYDNLKDTKKEKNEFSVQNVAQNNF